VGAIIVSYATTANWSVLDRESLYSYFYSLNQRVVGKKLTPDQIHRLITRHVKRLLPVKIKKHIDAKILERHIYMGGVYYSEPDSKGKPAIEVNFSYHPFDEHLKMTDYRWKRMSLRFADVMLHEIIHMRQFRARGFKELPGYQSTAESAKYRKNQQYYGDRDEMGAFAFNIACEMIDRFGYEPATIKRYMDTNGAKRHKNSWWYSYLHYFEFDHNHKIILRMKRKILTQLENAYIGKPFKTPDWLTY
jgi:hypothetical protein